MSNGLNIKYKAEPTASLFHQDNSFVRGIMGPIGCWTGETEYLSLDGWRPIGEYSHNSGELVGGYDPETQRVEFVKPLDYIDKPATQWVTFSGKASTFKLTMSEDHYMPVSHMSGHKWINKDMSALELASLKGQTKLLSTYTVKNNDSPASDALIKYAVALNADGSMSTDTKDCVNFGFHKERKVERLISILEELSKEYPEIKWWKRVYQLKPDKCKNGNTQYTVIVVKHAPYTGKTFNDKFFWSLGGSELRVLVEELTHWDGHMRGATGYEKKLRVFDTARESDVGFIQYAANACGYRSTVSVECDNNSKHSNLFRICMISKESIKHPVGLRAGHTNVDIIDGKTGDRKYCFTMPTGYFIVRQNGQVFVSHNSGKSVACIMEILSRALRQPISPDGVRYSRWACIRQTYPELKSTTIKTWEDWIPSSICPIKYDAPITGHMKLSDIGDGSALDFEVVFLAIDKPQDVKKLLSIEFTGIWINEAKELDKAVLDMATGRVGRYPGKSKTGGAHYWSGIIMDTNPMDEDGWWYHLAEEELPKGYRFFRQPGAVIYDGKKYRPNPLAENIKNHTEGFNYYLRQIPGKDHEWIKVYVMGEYGAIMDGKPVYPEYSDMIHCPEADPEPMKNLPLVVSFDFGLTPACVIGQLSPRGQLVILDEIVSENMGIRQFANEVVIPYLSSNYRGFDIHSTGDPAGQQRAQSNETTCMDELKAAGLLTQPAWTNEFTARREAVAGFLNKLVDGKPAFIISKKCKMVRKGFLGGYCYKRIQVSGRKFKDKPDKNEYSHPHDALQYLAMYLVEHKQRSIKAQTRIRSHNQYSNGPIDSVAGY